MKEGVIPSEILTCLQAQFGDECLSQPRVLSWPKSFPEARDRLEMNRTLGNHELLSIQTF
jgi:hypothetical protein